jgi:hypothetical protein
MSINRDSPTDRYRRDRLKVNASTFTNTNSNQTTKHCDICPQFRMEIRDTPAGKCYVCVRGCGQSIPITTSNSDSNDKGKYQNKYGTASGRSNSFILSKGKRKKSEDEADLALFGYSSDGVKLIDEQTMTYSEGGWH